MNIANKKECPKYSSRVSTRGNVSDSNVSTSGIAIIIKLAVNLSTMVELAVETLLSETLARAETRDIFKTNSLGKPSVSNKVRGEYHEMWERENCYQ